MNQFKVRFGIVICLLIGVYTNVNSQIYDTVPGAQYQYDSRGMPIRRDSSNETLKHRDIYEDSITVFFHRWDSTRIDKIDSSIDDFYSRFPVPWTYHDLGNLGTAAESFLFRPNMTPGFDPGFHSYDIYMYTLDGTKFFQTTRPYSETVYLLGSKTEQLINLFHTQNRKSNFNFGLDFRVVSSPGSYKNQSTVTSNSRINTFYQSNNKRYTNTFVFITNKILSSENGGVQPSQAIDSLFMNNSFGAATKLGDALGFNRSVFNSTVPIGTQYKQMMLLMRHSYDFGQKDSLVTDSVTYKLFYPRLRLQHTISYAKNNYEYHDYLPADSDYLRFFNYVNPPGTDTIVFNDTWQNFTNDFAIISYPEKNNLNQFLKLNTGIELIKGETSALVTNYDNVYAGAEYRNRTRNQLYDIEAAGKLYVTGHYAGDYSAYISFKRSLRKNVGSIQVGLQNVNRTPSFVQSEYVTDAAGIKQSLTSFPVIQDGSFNKENITRIFAVINVPPADLQITGEYYLITNYAYFNSLYTSTQYSPLFNILDIGAQKKMDLSKHWAWYLEGNLQQATGNPPVNVPLVLARSRIAYEGNFFKNLFLSTGFEVRYNTPYKADGYSPLNGQFIVQDTETISNRPDINAYLNFRIKSFKGFIRLENLNTLDLGNGLQFTKYNYTAPGYPGRGLWFRMGIWWSFVN